MSKKNYDDPAIEEQWCNSQRDAVAEYLKTQGVNHGQIGEWPAWHLAPYVSIWAIESAVRPNWIGWWVISGDLPKDYLPASDITPPQHPRKAMRGFAERWQKIVEAWKNGREYDGITIGDISSHKELGPLLEKRVALLLEFADDDSIWGDR